MAELLQNQISTFDTHESRAGVPELADAPDEKSRGHKAYSSHASIRTVGSAKKLPDVLTRPDLEMVYPDAMAVILQHRKEERAIRERQLHSGATRLTHIRPARAKASEVGSLARFRSGYRKNSFFGPFCEVISSRLISNISELSAVETTYLAPEFKSVERLRSRDWARATKIEVLVLQTIPDEP